MHRSRHIRMLSHVTFKWVLSHTNTSHMYAEARHGLRSWAIARCISSLHVSQHTWMRHVAHERVMSHTDESCHVWMRSHVAGRVVGNSRLHILHAPPTWPQHPLRTDSKRAVLCHVCVTPLHCRQGGPFEEFRVYQQGTQFPLCLATKLTMLSCSGGQTCYLLSWFRQQRLKLHVERE